MRQDDASAPLAVAVLASGHGSNLQALLDAIAAGRVPARMACAISDRGDATALERARRAGVPAVFLDPAAHAGRTEYDEALNRVLERHGAGLVALAGFMRILGSAFVQRWRGRILNVHPSLLPAYRGLHTHRRVLEASDAEHGASVHFVTDELDGGPVVIQAVVPVLAGDDEEALAARVRQQEHRIYPWAVARFAEGRLRATDAVEYDGRPLLEPLRVDAETNLEQL